MIQGLYAAANGMIAVEDRQAVIANNIANVSTNGFKRQMSVQTGFYGTFTDSRSAAALGLEVAPGGGLKTSETFTHHSNGSVLFTGSPLDVALIGEGFLHLQGEQGDLYTRNGQMSISPAGTLVSAGNIPVLDTAGNEIDVTGTSVSIDDAGNVLVDGAVRAQLAVIRFEDPHALLRVGENLFQGNDETLAQSSQAVGTVIASGSLEGSNVELPTEMVNMMMALRAYAANQKVISAIDETTSRMIDQVGSPS